MQDSLASVDPQPGDRVTKGKKTRTVTRRDGGDIEYVTETGRKALCWISTWRSWCLDADSAITARQPNG
jgi:hypothetical protein